MQATVHTDDGYLPMPAVVSQEVDNIVLLYGSSTDEQWRALAFQVNQTNRRVQQYDQLPTLNPGGTLDFGFLGEDGHSQDVSQPGKDVLRVADERNETIMEYGIAVKPSGVLVGVENPAGELVSGIQDADRLRGFSPLDASGNNPDFRDFGAAYAEHSHTDTALPTTALSPSPRQGLVRFDRDDNSQNTIYFGFYNAREDPAALDLLAWGQTYKVTNVSSPQVVRRMYRGEGYKRRVLTYGGLQNHSPKIPSEWKGNEVTITTGDVNSSLSGGGQ